MSSEMTGTQKPEGRGMRKWALPLIIILFILPFSLALILHLVHWNPGGNSYGELIAPPHSLQLTALQDAQGKPFNAQQWKKKWNLVTIAIACDTPCQSQVHLLQQVHVSLGKEMQRVQRVLLMPAIVKSEDLLDLQHKYPELIVLAGTDVADLAHQFDLPGRSAAQAERVYLVDPLGNLMMSYPQDYDPKGLRKDLTRLLKNSWAG